MLLLFGLLLVMLGRLRREWVGKRRAKREMGTRLQDGYVEMLRTCGLEGKGNRHGAVRCSGDMCKQTTPRSRPSAVYGRRRRLEPRVSTAKRPRRRRVSTQRQAKSCSLQDNRDTSLAFGVYERDWGVQLGAGLGKEHFCVLLLYEGWAFRS
jgi:hypothetical protein